MFRSHVFSLTVAICTGLSTQLHPACVLLTWGVLAYGALTRPAYLSGLNKQVGMTGIPDPMRHLHLSPGGAQ